MVLRLKRLFVLALWLCRGALYHALEGWRLVLPWIACPVRELTAHEMRGHTIGRHVGILPRALGARVVAEGRRAVSSFWNLTIARASINYAVVIEFDLVTQWFLAGQTKRFPLTVATPSFTSIGYGILENDGRIRYSREITVVLERAGPTFYVLTAYPRIR